MTTELKTLEEVINAQYMELRVSNGTPVQALATSILRYFEEGRKVALSCIGAQAAAQALKACAVANGEAGQQGKFFAIVPSFDVKKVRENRPGPTQGDEIELTAIRLIVGRIPITL
jgi:stage V sporulation protein SpoVS